MRLFEPGLHHYLWTKGLLQLPAASQVRAALAALGELRYRTMARARRDDIAQCYAAFSQRALAAGFSIDATPADLMQNHIRLRPLLGIAPALVAFGRENVVQELFDSTGLDQVLAAYRRGKGVVVMTTHFGATGCISGMLCRHGIDLLVIRDSQFRRYEGTRHGRHYYLGAETLFPDHADPKSADRVLLRCARALRAGRVVSYVCDAGHGRSTTPGQVLGVDVPWRMALPALARRTGSLVVPVFLP